MDQSLVLCLSERGWRCSVTVRDQLVLVVRIRFGAMIVGSSMSKLRRDRGCLFFYGRRG
jgi:hypothetical protein